MSNGRTATNAAQRVGTGAGRLVRAWRALPHDRRPAVFASIGLFITLFLPWYQETIVAPGVAPRTASVTGWGAFSWVEAAVLLVAAGVVTLLFQRAEGRAFHLPGGDGGVIAAAGFWTSVLVIWRIFDKSASTSVHGTAASLTGVEWGIFIALAVAASLAWAGNRIRKAHDPEPALPGDQVNGAPPGDPEAQTVRSRGADDPEPPTVRSRRAVDREPPTVRSRGPVERATTERRRSEQQTLRFEDPPPDQPAPDQLTMPFDSD
jgi:hypothetical protein